MAIHNGKRQTFLDQLLRRLPASPAWDAWLEYSGELPPDFDTLPSFPGLIDRLHYDAAGRYSPIQTAEEWYLRREDVKQLFHHWMLGRTPPAPETIQAVMVSETQGQLSTSRVYQLRFGPQHSAHLQVEVLLPRDTGRSPLPVLVTQYNHRGWAALAVSRGYIACVYAGADLRDDTDSFVAAYPGYDWSKLMRRAWAASRVVDFVLADVPEAAPDQIAITGHSRNGKQSLFATAFDDRFSAVIVSSAGAGGVLPARLGTQHFFAESIGFLTQRFPDWFHPRLRFFVGREHKLPFDMHDLIALVAPRSCLLACALNDSFDSAWASHQSYLAARKVFRFLDSDDKLRILWRHGNHETSPTDINLYLDWLDTCFGYSTQEFPGRQWFFDPPVCAPEAADSAAGPVQVPENDSRLECADLAEWTIQQAQLRRQIEAALGQAPPCAPTSFSARSYGIEPPHVAMLLDRETFPLPEGVQKHQYIMGEYVNADVYSPPDRSGKTPLVIWLHPFSFSSGYTTFFNEGEPLFHILARSGAAVLCFDQIGYGYRLQEATRFYERYPAWSLLGKMVRDTRAAIDLAETLTYVDPTNISVVGYALGGIVGLHTAALDERLSRVVAMSVPQAAPSDSANPWPLLCRTPPDTYQLRHLIAAVAPRKLMLISPQADQAMPLEAATTEVEHSRPVYGLYGAASALEQIRPATFGQFDQAIKTAIAEWLVT